MKASAISATLAFALLGCAAGDKQAKEPETQAPAKQPVSATEIAPAKDADGKGASGGCGAKGGCGAAGGCGAKHEDADATKSADAPPAEPAAGDTAVKSEAPTPAAPATTAAKPAAPKPKAPPKKATHKTGASGDCGPGTCA